MTTKQRQSGSVLIVTLFTALLMAVFIVGFLGITTVDLNVSTNTVESLQAYYIAEAGIADAMAQMRQSGAMADKSWTSTYPAGSSDQYSVTVSNSSGLIISQGQTSPLGFSRALEVAVNVSGGSAPYTVTVKSWEEVVN